jgi:S-(hydroxymethyl)glutathione dehydrogenase/alcohol dehydrogenase
MIVGVDVNPAREALARKFGLTHFVNRTTCRRTWSRYSSRLTGGGADYSFDASAT